jgi:hypothetical protein
VADLDHHLARLPEDQAVEKLVETPGISEAFIHKCLRDMQTLGLIDPPSEGRTRSAPRPLANDGTTLVACNR